MPLKRMLRALAPILMCLMLALLLCACGGEPEAEASPSPTPAVTPTPTPTPTPPAEPELPYVNPLTGEGCETDIAGQRPVAVMINNLKKANPQLGCPRRTSSMR